jgi:MFS family permease
VVAATVLGSGLAFIDATVVNVALPSIGDSLGASLSSLTWTINAYTLTLAAMILLGGSLGDRFGRRVFVTGVVWFALASLLCGLAPNVETLIAARALQGVGGALLTPGSLAILQSAFRPEDRGRAIGARPACQVLPVQPDRSLVDGWCRSRPGDGSFSSTCRSPSRSS